MGEWWEPIESAPIDGTPILLSNGERFAAGKREFRVEPDTTIRGLNAEGKFHDKFLERIPNPDAGKRHEWWSLFGCSAFTSEIDVYDYDGPSWFEPTHWMPLPDMCDICHKRPATVKGVRMRSCEHCATTQTETGRDE